VWSYLYFKNRLRVTYDIKQAIYEFELKFDNALYDHVMRKEPDEFWKCWSRKFNRNKLGNLPSEVNGASDDTSIANEFMKHFGSVYFDSNLDDKAVICIIIIIS